ncbi:MAG: hypothetical protein K0S81_3476, partial [Rhodospirillales bacterium]|nr:hypothetical protein [Rhodospirillales bacterium]
MRLRLFLLSFALVNLSYNGVEYAMTAQSETRPAVLSAEDMMRILPGNTLLAYDESGPFWMYYPSPGTVWGRSSSGDVDIGSWWIEDGRYCRSWRRWYDGQTQCWQLASYGEDRIVWLDGAQAIQGESLIQHGNAIGEVRPPLLASAATDIEIEPIAVTASIGPDPRAGDRSGRGSGTSRTGSSGGGSSGGGSSSGGSSSGGSSGGGSSGGGSSGGGSSGGGSSGGGSSGGGSSGGGS